MRSLFLIDDYSATNLWNYMPLIWSPLHDFIDHLSVIVLASHMESTKSALTIDCHVKIFARRVDQHHALVIPAVLNCQEQLISGRDGSYNLTNVTNCLLKESKHALWTARMSSPRSSDMNANKACSR